MRVGKVTGDKDLVGFYFAQQVAYDFHVGFADRVLLNLTRFIERQVEEVAVIQRDIVISTCRTRFAATNQPFDGQDIAGIHIAVFLIFQIVADFGVFLVDDLVFAVVEELVEAVDEVQEADYFFIAYGNVTGSLVCHMHVMFLLYQTADSTAHRDDVIIRVRREYNDTFGIRFSTFGTIGVVCVRLAARPTGDGMLQVVENLDIYVVCRAVKGKQFTQTVFVVVFVGQL